MNKPCATFIMVAILSISCLAVAAGLIFKDLDDANGNRTIGVGLLMSVVGIWVPSPKWNNQSMIPGGGSIATDDDEESPL